MAGCHPGPQGSYHDSFDGEVLQASVPRGVKDHRQCLVGSLDVANLHFILEGCRAAAACATVLAHRARCGVDPPHLLTMPSTTNSAGHVSPESGSEDASRPVSCTACWEMSGTEVLTLGGIQGCGWDVVIEPCS